MPIRQQTLNVDPRMLELFDFRARKGDLKKIEIIQAAIEVLADQGLENTTYESLALKINSRRAHVAYHFNDKKTIFLAAVKYILGDFQQSVLDSLERAYEEKKGPVHVLQSYVDGVFDWASQNPSQLSVMLLLYYQCTLDPDYIELHEKIRKSGSERLGLLFQQVKGASSPELCGKWLQNQLSGAMMDSVTTHSTTLEQAREKTHKFLDLLIK